METHNCKQLIISLITDDLIHTKLAAGLAALGLNPDRYTLTLSDTIIKLMGFDEEQDEHIYASYIGWLKRARFINNNGIKSWLPIFTTTFVRKTTK